MSKASVPLGDGRERRGTIPRVGGLYCELLVTACVSQGLDELKENARLYFV